MTFAAPYHILNRNICKIDLTITLALEAISFHNFLKRLHGISCNTYQAFIYLTLFYMGGGWYTPPGGLSFAAHWWVPQIGWFFMSLFLAILELSWTGHFWNFFENFKNFCVDKFFQNRSKGGTILYKSQKVEKGNFFLFQIQFFLLEYEL